MLDRIRSAMSPAAMIVSVLALVLAGAGVGYSAGTIGTSDLKNNAVTSPKVKNGTLKAADLVKEKKYAEPTLGVGTEGDCVWEDVAGSLPGIATVSSRKDRFGTTHLAGIAVGGDGAGGDGMCGGGSSEDSIDDYTVFTLPAAQVPATTLYSSQNSGDTLLIIAGAGGFNIGAIIPEGAILCAGTTLTCFLDGITLETSSAKVTPRSLPGRHITPQGRQMVMKYLNR